MAKVIIIGPAHPLREGGIVSFNHRLARAYQQAGHSCEIWSFSLQYPSFLFPGRSQYSSAPAPSDLVIHSAINSIDPVNWWRVGQRLRRERADLVIVRFWLPLMGPALGTILRQVKKNRHSRIVCIADNIVPHEKRPGDRLLTRYFLNACEAFITMSDTVTEQLRGFQKTKPHQQVDHPLYDHFGDRVSKQEARARLGIAPHDKLLLFFGFIRHYKGLDHLLHAMADQRVKAAGIKLMIAGEFYENPQPYLSLIEQLQLQDRLIQKTDFIEDNEVRYYVCAADGVVQPYRQATQSGVTPLAYHFEKPMIVTRVGGLPAMVPHEVAGLVCEPDSKAIADAILRFYELGEDHFKDGLIDQKKKYSWNSLVNATLQLAGINVTHA